jgi:hypothetical protein
MRTAKTIVLLGWFFTAYTPINFNMGPFVTKDACERTRPNYIKGVGVSPRCFESDSETTPRSLGVSRCPIGGGFICKQP